MKTELFDYNLPPGLIAHVPTSTRGESRLMVVDRKSGQVEHCIFRDIPQLLPPNAKLFRNNATVFKARIFAQRESGGSVECLLLHRGKTDQEFWCLLKPGKKLPPGSRFAREEHFEATVLEKNDSGEYLVTFQGRQNESVVELAEAAGVMPLPPYIERKNPKNPELNTLDAVRYQTVYADPQKKVAAAAPTAGLHFTPSILEQLKAENIQAYEITLHIGLGTFQPIKSDHLSDHRIHKEFYEISLKTQQALSPHPGQPRIAVGTTSLRAIEDFFQKSNSEKATAAFSAQADIFIYPPATFRGVDSLITNFHLPRSTLICLVSAFLTPGSDDGIKWLKELYAIAIDKEYRFFSYGDAMLIL